MIEFSISEDGSIGSTLTVGVTWTGIDEKVRQLKVGLVCEAVANGEVSAVGATELATIATPSADGSGEVEVSIPFDATPSYTGKLFEIQWLPVATMDLPRARDITERGEPITVWPRREPVLEELANAPKPGASAKPVEGLSRPE